MNIKMCKQIIFQKEETIQYTNNEQTKCEPEHPRRVEHIETYETSKEYFQAVIVL